MSNVLANIYRENVMENVVEVHPFSNNPTKAWQELSKTRAFTKLTLESSSDVEQNHLRIVCMSDTHSRTDSIPFEIPLGDVFIHAGDFTKFGDRNEIIKFNKWLRSLPHRHKIIIAGNHDITLDSSCFDSSKSEEWKSIPDKMKKLLKDCVYLEDSWIEICGLKIYGAPWQPQHCGMAFELPRGEQLLSKWNLIPEDTDILITHGPPVGYGDEIDTGERVGCVELLSTVQRRVKPKYHIFGHIHEAYGVSTDGTTTFINAATCDATYAPINPPVIFDLPRKQTPKLDDQACLIT